MQVQTAKKIVGLLLKTGHEEIGKYHLEKHIKQKNLSGFHQWANDRPCEGAFLFKNSAGKGIWIILIDWRNSDNFYVVLFPESKSGPIAEIHQVVKSHSESFLQWRYSPRKRDQKNDERRAYFAEIFLSTDVQISIPQIPTEVDDFIDDLFALADGKEKANRLDPDRSVIRTGFPEGKFKEKLHLSRERNQTLVRQAKAQAMARVGSLKCVCCSFDFLENYGEVGRGFIEAHHTKPISELHEGGEETKIEDLALVCSNCHRMLHRKRPWLKMDELSGLLAANNSLKR
ncbi:MAG: HNH endonuclease [Pseudomonadales bacterium]